MSRAVKFFLLVIAPILALLLALLGFWSLPANPTGWFLLLVGVAFTAGLMLDFAIRKKRFWEAASTMPPAREERDDRSFWFISLGMIAAFYLSPVEYLYLFQSLPRNTWIAWIGVALSALGVCLFVWARRILGDDFSGHLTVKPDQTLVQTGPYRMIRHPAYAGYLSMALGISLGYSSLLGLLSTLVLLIPGLAYRIKVEERLLFAHFGQAYRQYASRTRRVIPGIW
jgi:protein-S-isoprenylcysteine O-methyltransferase Ste14